MGLSVFSKVYLESWKKDTIFGERLIAMKLLTRVSFLTPGSVDQKTRKIQASSHSDTLVP